MSGVLKIWNGSSWEEIEISAPVGPIGPTGPTGPTGPLAGTANQVVYKDGSNNPTGSANLTFDGTTLSTAALTVDTTTLFVDATNDRVGIGTATPSSKLEVRSGVSDTVGLSIYTANTTDNAYSINFNRAGTNVQNAFNWQTSAVSKWFLGQDNSGTNPEDIILYSWTSNKFTFKAYDSTGDIGFGNDFRRIYVQNAGSVGVNTTGPSSQLHVVAGASTTIGQIVQGAASQSANLQEWRGSDGTVLARVTSAGNISIPTLFVDYIDLTSDGFISSSSLYGARLGWNTTYLTVAGGNFTFEQPGSSVNVNINGRLVATNQSAANIAAVVRGAASQSANLQEWQNSSGTILASMSASGAFSAATKSFDIEHPTKPNMRLQYGSVEAPEHSVQIRGRSNNKIINLPDYWSGLVDENTITVQLTPVGCFQELFVKDFNSSIVEIDGPPQVDFFYLVSAERKDVPKLVVEYGS